MFPFSFIAVLMQQHDFYFGVSSRGFIGWIILGLLAGWIAGHITRDAREVERKKYGLAGARRRPP